MSRAPRLAVANYPHHIVQRGHCRGKVFFSDADRLDYLATLREFQEKLALSVYGYCLMTNHIHLIVVPTDTGKSLSELMRRLAGRHTRRINRLKSRTGSVWEGRFKCSPIESDRYLLACCRYVDLNPVRAGLVDKPEKYRWSSYRSKIGLDSCDWLALDPGFLALAEVGDCRQRRYREFVEAGITPEELATIRTAVARDQLTGTVQFAADFERQTGRRVSTRGRGRPQQGTDLANQTEQRDELLSGMRRVPVKK